LALSTYVENTIHICTILHVGIRWGKNTKGFREVPGGESPSRLSPACWTACSTDTFVYEGCEAIWLTLSTYVENTIHICTILHVGIRWGKNTKGFREVLGRREPFTTVTHCWTACSTDTFVYEGYEAIWLTLSTYVENTIHVCTILQVGIRWGKNAEGFEGTNQGDHRGSMAVRDPISSQPP
jgi:hypothetical protein